MVKTDDDPYIGQVDGDVIRKHCKNHNITPKIND